MAKGRYRKAILPLFFVKKERGKSIGPPRCVLHIFQTTNIIRENYQLN